MILEEEPDSEKCRLEYVTQNRSLAALKSLIARYLDLDRSIPENSSAPLTR